jgi:hypothetical protein
LIIPSHYQKGAGLRGALTPVMMPRPMKLKELETKNTSAVPPGQPAGAATV